MGPIIPWLFDPIVEDNGNRVPFSRFDLVGSVIMAVAIVITVLFVAEGNFRKACMAFLVAIAPIPLVEAKRTVILIGLGIAAARIIPVFGMMALVHHPFRTIAFAVVAFLCVRKRPRYS